MNKELTPSEVRLLGLRSAGFTWREVANRLVVSRARTHQLRQSIEAKSDVWLGDDFPASARQGGAELGSRLMGELLEIVRHRLDGRDWETIAQAIDLTPEEIEALRASPKRSDPRRRAKR